MVTIHFVLYVLALVSFVLAAFPNLTSPSAIRFEWLAAAFITLTFLI